MRIQPDKQTRRRDRELGEMRRQRDKETERQGDRETGRQGGSPGLRKFLCRKTRIPLRCIRATEIGARSVPTKPSCTSRLRGGGFVPLRSYLSQQAAPGVEFALGPHPFSRARAVPLQFAVEDPIVFGFQQ